MLKHTVNYRASICFLVCRIVAINGGQNAQELLDNTFFVDESTVHLMTCLWDLLVMLYIGKAAGRIVWSARTCGHFPSGASASSSEDSLHR